MAAPSTISAVGYFLATRAGTAAGQATLRMNNATHGTLSLGGHSWKLSADPVAKTFHGTAFGSVVDLKIVNRSHLKGTVDSSTLELVRLVLGPISAVEMAQSDPRPTGATNT